MGVIGKAENEKDRDIRNGQVDTDEKIPKKPKLHFTYIYIYTILHIRIYDQWCWRQQFNIRTKKLCTKRLALKRFFPSFWDQIHGSDYFLRYDDKKLNGVCVCVCVCDQQSIVSSVFWILRSISFLSRDDLLKGTILDHSSIFTKADLKKI